jgi:hypothetical protein
MKSMFGNAKVPTRLRNFTASGHNYWKKAAKMDDEVKQT